MNGRAARIVGELDRAIELLSGGLPDVSGLTDTDLQAKARSRVATAFIPLCQCASEA